MYHKPVLLKESLKGLNIRPGGTYVDFTFGGGGHAAAILSCLGQGRLVAFDQDPDALTNRPDDRRLLLIRGNFRYVKNYLRFYNIGEIDGGLADLGVSSHQFDVRDRGFSFRFNSALDMRMNPDSEKTAGDILNTYVETELRELFRRYGEIRNSECLAAAVCDWRQGHRIMTSGQLLEAIRDCVPARGRHKFLARVFQALRIEVNDELNALRELLEALPAFLNNGARLAVITYHSLEDRMVKNFFRSGNVSGKVEKDFYGNVLCPFRLVNKDVITPGEAETRENPRARSAKLRVAEKIKMDAGRQ